MSDDHPSAANPQPNPPAAGTDGYAVAPEPPHDAGVPTPKRTLSPDEVTWIKDTLWARDESEQRFSLVGLFAIVTAAAVALAVGIRLPRPVFAGLTGFATLAGIVVLSLMSSPSAALRLAWWVLLGIYLLAMGVAIWG